MGCRSSNIGGQAVIEGIMMRAGDNYAIAVRKPDQDIEVKVEKYKELPGAGKLKKIPVIRGMFAFVDSLVIGIRCLMYSASFFEDEEEGDGPKKVPTEEELRKKEKEDSILMTGTLIFSFIMAIGLPAVSGRILSGKGDHVPLAAGISGVADPRGDLSGLHVPDLPDEGYSEDLYVSRGRA